MSGHLPTELWVKAHLARCSTQGIPLVVVRRGDPHRGVVMVKIHMIDSGFRIVSQSRNLDGDLVWVPALDGRLVAEQEADAYIERQVSYDPDLWVVEVETHDDEGWFRGAVV